MRYKVIERKIIGDCILETERDYEFEEFEQFEEFLYITGDNSYPLELINTYEEDEGEEDDD